MTSLAQLRALAEAATPGPYTAQLVDECEPVSPDVWRVHGSDDSYEATICECWTGEQNNEAQARYIAALSPSVVLAMIECIEASKRVRANTRIPGDTVTECKVPDCLCHSGADFDAALAKLEQEQGR